MFSIVLFLHLDGAFLLIGSFKKVTFATPTLLCTLIEMMLVLGTGNGLNFAFSLDTNRLKLVTHNRVCRDLDELGVQILPWPYYVTLG